jgi:site-specific recombinase XerD
MRDEIDQFLTTEGIRWSPNTGRQYRIYLMDLADWCQREGLELQALTTPDLIAWLNGHRGWGDASRYTSSIAIRSFLRFTMGRAHSPAEQFRMRRPRATPQRTLSQDEIGSLVSSLDTCSDRGFRNLAIILTMLDCGLRASELCAVSTEHVDLEQRSLVVRVKGGSWGRRVFSQYTASVLATWWCVRNQLARADCDRLFISLGGRRGGHTAAGGPLTRDGLRAIFRAMASNARIRCFSPHALRRSFATLSIQAGAPSRLVQLQGGWSDLSMVERYTQALSAEDFAPYSPVARIMHAGDT